MRHGASLLASLEGMSRPAYRIAYELTNNSRSGLTVRFLSKKLDMREEEIEYLLDLNHRLLFVDLTKVKIVGEGQNAVKRITEGLENLGDVPSLFRRVKSLNAHDFRRLEEFLGLEEPLTKKQAAEELLERVYKHPDSAVTYVASGNFSEMARDIFDALWQSKGGVMSVSQLRTACRENEYAIEQGLAELVRGFAAFEMFRFDAEERLVRVVGLLKELRQYREANAGGTRGRPKLKPLKNRPATESSRGLDFSETLCKIVAAVAARPARLRGDGELFREDRRRLSDICAEDADPSLNTCLWATEGLEWLTRIDNELVAGELEPLIQRDRIQRHKLLFDWLTHRGDESTSRRLLTDMLDEVRTDQWYKVSDFIAYVQQAGAQEEQPVLKQTGAHWQYVTPGTSGATQSRLARSLEETLYWLGLVARGELDGDSVIRLTDIGLGLLRPESEPKLRESYPRHQSEFVVQPNFDIVVPTEDTDPLLTVPLEQFATRMSSGLALVYHVSKESFTQAMQVGHDAGKFVNFLLTHNRSGSLPTNVTITLEDWRGGLKRVRMRTIAILESDDPLVMADLIHRKRLQQHLSPIESSRMVIFKGMSEPELTKVLEKEGFIVE